MARERRDVQRVLRGSAAPRLVGVPKKWNAAEAEEEARHRADKGAGAGHGRDGVHGLAAEEGDEGGKKQDRRRCEHPQEARTDQRWGPRQKTGAKFAHSE